MFGWFLQKKEIKNIKDDTKQGFESVKKDIGAVSGWIKHLDSEKNIQKKDIESLKNDLSSIKEEIESIKNIVSMMGEMKTQQPFKTLNNSL
ncbi:MAG: hypothetical protein QT05_C0017G0005 [archaeon GW2011_AR13]|nr:MAG: hypothetical protein QT05_C0017G0005 [archaeon GW2011_AR13]